MRPVRDPLQIEGDHVAAEVNVAPVLTAARRKEKDARYGS